MVATYHQVLHQDSKAYYHISAGLSPCGSILWWDNKSWCFCGGPPELNQQLFELLQTCLSLGVCKSHETISLFRMLIDPMLYIKKKKKYYGVFICWISWTEMKWLHRNTNVKLSKFTFCSLSGSRGWTKRNNSETHSWLMSFIIKYLRTYLDVWLKKMFQNWIRKVFQLKRLRYPFLTSQGDKDAASGLIFSCSKSFWEM